MASSNSAVDLVPAGWKHLVQQPRKRGRPRLESTLGSLDDVIAHRKERVRLAQRAYRNRRDTKVDDLRARVAQLEQALEQTTSSFTKFKNLVSQDEELPPRLAVLISRTALEMASAVQRTRSENSVQTNSASREDNPPKDWLDSEEYAGLSIVENETIGSEQWLIDDLRVSSSSIVSSTFSSGVPSKEVSNLVYPVDLSFTPAVQKQTFDTGHQETRRGTWFTSLLLQLCSEQGMQLLTSPDTTFEDLHPALSIHLTRVPIDQLREQCLRARANNFEHMHQDPEQGAIFGSPDMYRSIEGSDRFMVPRSGKLEPQQLIHGRTRTRLGTDLQDFQGEWLEPIDVQEFLEDFGIALKDRGSGGVLQIAILEGKLRDICTHDASAVFSEEIQRSRMMATSKSFDEKKDDELIVQCGEPRQNRGHQSSTFPREGHFRGESNESQAAGLHSFLQHQTLRNTDQSVLKYGPNRVQSVETFIDITLHLDRMMRFLVLAASCIGSGPGIRREAIEHALRVSIIKQ